LPVPPLPEQRAIAAYLDRETAKIDAAIVEIETSIARPEEYRTALISAAVTGKIDVRTVATLQRTETARLTFDQVTEQLFAEMIDNYYEFYKKVTDDPQAKHRFFDWLFEQYERGAQEQSAD